MKYLLGFCLFLVGCTVDTTFGTSQQDPKPQILNADVVKIRSRYFPNDIAVAEYKHGNTKYLIFKCGDQLFVQKVEDTLGK